MPNLNLTDEFRQDRGLGMIMLINQDIEDRRGLLKDLQVARALYFNQPSASSKLPWPGASDIHLPVVTEKIESTVPKLVNSFWGTEPIVHVRRVAEDFVPEETNQAEQFINWAIESDIPDFYQTTENWFRNTLLDGTATVKIRWDKSWRKAVEVFPLKIMLEAGEPSPADDQVVPDTARPKMAIEFLVEIFGKPDQLSRALLDFERLDDGDDLMGSRWRVEFLEDRRRLECTVRFAESEFVDEVDVYVYRRVLEDNNPCVELMEFEDLIVPYRTSDLQSASRVVHQYWLTVPEIEAKVAEGEWQLTDEDMEMIRAHRTERQEEKEDNDELRRQKDRREGYDTIETREHEIVAPAGVQPYNENHVLVFEVYVCDDVDGDGEPIEVVYQIPYGLRKIARADYLDEVCPHGRRPFVTLKYLPVSDRFYAMGMGELLVDINIEVNTIINNINNNQELINSPFFFYVPAATTVDPQVLEGITPGQGIPIQDINGVIFPKFQQTPLANFSAMDSLLLFADRVTISPMNAGSPQVRNAPRTARGTLAMLSEGNIKTDLLVTRFQRTGWVETVHQVMGLYQRFMPSEKWFYVTGDPEPRRIRQAQIRGRYEYTFTGNTVNTNREVLRTIAQVRYNTIMTHPDYGQDPIARREALRDFLRHWSEGVDIDRLLPALPGQGAYTHPPMRQQEENQAMAMGLAVDVLPSDPDAEHLQVMEQFEGTPAFENLPPEAVAVYALHKRAHMLQLQQKMSSARLEAQGGGDAKNVPTGMTQAEGGTDLNALEGGNV